jgi:hypothetical protein
MSVCSFIQCWGVIWDEWINKIKTKEPNLTENGKPSITVRFSHCQNVSIDRFKSRSDKKNILKKRNC